MTKTETKKVKKIDHSLTGPVPETTIVPQPIEVLAVPADFKQQKKFTREQIELIKSQIAKDATDDELKLFLYACERTGLDPFSRQIYLIGRWNSKANGGRGGEVKMVQVSIDGFRSIAERTLNYAGNDDPVFGEIEDVKSEKEGTIKVPSIETLPVHKIVKGQRYPFTASARWKQYYPGDKQGFMWRKMPHVMLGKCAEALALRKAFPSVMAGLYVPEEMEQARVLPPAAQIAQDSEDLFETAKRMIKATSIDQAEKFMENLKGSKKYTAEQKKELTAACADQIEAIKKDIEKQTA